MAEMRKKLDDKLREVLRETTGRVNLYYQPPANLRMQYPCIRYELNRIRGIHANGHIYNQHFIYTVTVIDTDPDSKITAAVSCLDQCRHDRRFTADNLYHDVFTISL